MYVLLRSPFVYISARGTSPARYGEWQNVVKGNDLSVRTAETCGGGGSSGIDDKTRYVGLHVHSFTSEDFVILVLTRVNTSSEIRSFSHPPRFRIILVQYSVTKDLKHMSFAFACKRWQPLNGRFFDGFFKTLFYVFDTF